MNIEHETDDSMKNVISIRNAIKQLCLITYREWIGAERTGRAPNRGLPSHPHARTLELYVAISMR